MLDKTIWEAQPSNTYIYNLNCHTKIVLLLVMSLTSILLDSPKTLLLVFLLVILMHILSKSSLAQWRTLLIFLLLSMWGTIVSQALFYNQEPRTEIFCLIAPQKISWGELNSGLYLYKEGIVYGAIQALRAGIMLSLGLLLCWNTDISRLMRALVQWRVPYEIAFMLTTSIRFIPVVFSEAAIVITAQKLKGFNPTKNLYPTRFIKTAFQTLLPIIARIIRRTEQLALSVECRGFSREITPQDNFNWPIKEQLLCVSLITLLIFIIFCKVIYSLHYNGIYYFTNFRYIYQITSLWM